MSSKSLKKHGPAVLLLAAVVLLTYGISLTGGFVWDDRPLIVDNRQVQDSARWMDNLTSSFWDTGDKFDRFRNFFRPVVALSYAVDHGLWGLRPAGFHATNLLLHFLCCWLVYAVALEGGLRRGAALLAGSLFAAHPVHVENVAWISGRTDLLCAVFFLAAFLLHRRSTDWWARAASWLCFALALFSKEMAATLPAVIACDLIWRGRRQNATGQPSKWLRVAPYFVILAAYVVVRQSVLGNPTPGLFDMTPLGWLASGAFVTGRYLTLLLLPAGLDAHYPYQPLAGFTAPAILGAAMLAVIVAAAERLRQRRPEITFWLLWVPLTLSPVMLFGRFGDVLMADRFLYIPSVGAVMLVALVAADVLAAVARPAGRRLVVAVAVALTLLLAGAAWNRSQVWRSDHDLFSDMVKTSPGSALVHSNLGMAQYGRGEFEPAVRSFQMAITLNPEFAMAYNNLAAALERRGQFESAILHYNKALQFAPELLEARANAGNLLVRMGFPRKGLPLLEKLTREHPGYAPALHALADSYHRLGRSDEALPLLERLVGLSPRYAPAHYLLGEVHHRAGRPVPAGDSLRRFLELWPQDDEHAAAARRMIGEIEFGS